MIGVGAVASVLTMELEGLQGVLHYLLYFAVTLILALIMGTQLAQPFARETAKKSPPQTTVTIPNVVQPKTPGAKPPQTPPAPPPSSRRNRE